MKEEVMVDLKIDLDSLDQEWLKQPGLYMKWAIKEARLRREKDRVKAKVDGMVRKKMIEEGEKITDTKVEIAINATEEYAEIRERRLITAFGVKAMDHRKKALEKEVDLWRGGYFSSPKQSDVDNADNVDIKREALNRASERQVKGLNK